MRVTHAGVAALTVLMAAALAGPTALVNGSAGAATSRATMVAVSPSPGDQFATPQTTISFRGVTPATLGPVRVTGSRSGVHAGRLVADPDGYTIWKPRTPFVTGERVSVHTAVPIADAGGDSFSFTVARIAPNAPQIPPPGSDTRPAATAAMSGPASSPGPRRVAGTCKPGLPSFRSEPDLLPPGACVNQTATGTAPGYLLVTPRGTGNRGNGAAIFDNRDHLIWYDPVDAPDVDNLQRVIYHGQPMLAFFQGRQLNDHGIGEGVLMNKHYQVVAHIRGGNGDQADQHELTITPQNTALIGCYVPVKMNLTAEGGTASQVVYAYVVQEIDVATGNVLFSWDSLDHVPVTDSYYSPPANGSVFDYFHGNSISLTPDGNLLISGRRVSAVYKVNRATGAVMWELGGKHSSFALAPGQQQFCYQHHARQSQPNMVTVFDDGGSGPSACPNHASRGLTLKLDTADHTATITRDLGHNPPLHASIWGSDQTLPNGDDLVSWGNLPEITEFNAANKPNFDMSFSGNTYRAFRAPWTGIPHYPPAVASVKGSGDAVTVYASWNGDTQVKSWQILAGSSPSALRPVGQPVAKVAFQARITVHTTAPLVAAQARNGSGKVLATSPAVPTSTPPGREYYVGTRGPLG